MYNNPTYYDCAVIGGGVAGLAAAAELGRKGFRVILFEKESYPFHKVCGEYVSLESMDYLAGLGLPLEEWDLPLIDTLTVSSLRGTAITQKLPLGGIGVSRYRLDGALSVLAREAGAEIMENTKVQDVRFSNDTFTIDTGRGSVKARVCCGTFGKHANLDVKWKRSFLQKKTSASGFVAVKYHARLDAQRNRIGLHYFRNGYCGISPIEDQMHCICYLTREENLRSHENDIRSMEEEVLAGNPFLKNIWKTADFLYDKPLTISRISFERKEQVKDHILMLGDAAGMIAPLCGNGISMALHSSKLAGRLIARFLQGECGRSEMEKVYIRQWQALFGSRVMAGRMIQYLFLRTPVANALVSALRPFPAIVNQIVKQTHGRQPF